MHVISNKEDCLGHIKALYGAPNTTEIGDKIWLDALESFGIQNMEYHFLRTVAAKMLRQEGELVTFEEFE